MGSRGMYVARNRQARVGGEDDILERYPGRTSRESDMVRRGRGTEPRLTRRWYCKAHDIPPLQPWLRLAATESGLRPDSQCARNIDFTYTHPQSCNDSAAIDRPSQKEPRCEEDLKEATCSRARHLAGPDRGTRDQAPTPALRAPARDPPPQQSGPNLSCRQHGPVRLPMSLLAFNAACSFQCEFQ